MKKSLAIIFSAIFILTCFAGCKARVKDKDLIKDNGGNSYAAVTQEDGGVVRDGAGNLIVRVTDANGKYVKENGEFVTNPIGLDHAIVVGNRIECPFYALTIPDGWEDNVSYSTLSINKTGTKDFITIMCKRNGDLNEEMQGRAKLIQALRDSDAKVKNEVNQDIKIGDLDAHVMGIYVADDKDVSAYTAFISYQQGINVYTVMITSDHDIGYEDTVKILNTMEYYY